jgi:hypothetical protein
VLNINWKSGGGTLDGDIKLSCWDFVWRGLFAHVLGRRTQLSINTFDPDVLSLHRLRLRRIHLWNQLLVASQFRFKHYIGVTSVQLIPGTQIQGQRTLGLRHQTSNHSSSSSSSTSTTASSTISSVCASFSLFSLLALSLSSST